MSIYLFALLLPMVGIVAWDAWHDRTPRVPRTPERVWWARRRTARERLRVHIRVK